MTEFRDTAPLKFSGKKDSALSLFFLSKSPGGQNDHNVDVYLQVNHRSQAPPRAKMGQRGNPRALAGICEFH